MRGYKMRGCTSRRVAAAFLSLFLVYGQNQPIFEFAVRPVSRLYDGAARCLRNLRRSVTRRGTTIGGVALMGLGLRGMRRYGGRLPRIAVGAGAASIVLGALFREIGLDRGLRAIRRELRELYPERLREWLTSDDQEQELHRDVDRNLADFWELHYDEAMRDNEGAPGNSRLWEVQRQTEERGRKLARIVWLIEGGDAPASSSSSGGSGSDEDRPGRIRGLCSLTHLVRFFDARLRRRVRHQRTRLEELTYDELRQRLDQAEQDMVQNQLRWRGANWWERLRYVDQIFHRPVLPQEVAVRYVRWLIEARWILERAAFKARPRNAPEGIVTFPGR